MQRQQNWAQGREGVADHASAAEADTQAYVGRIKKARNLSLEAAAMAERDEEPEAAAKWLLRAAFREA